jgi:hypothetical protein
MTVVSQREEVLLAGRESKWRVPMATHVRSTVIQSSISVIRERDRFGAYAAALPKVHHEVLFSLIAGAWVPMDVALAHYEAASALGFSAQEQYENGKMVVDRIGRTAFGLVGALAKTSGVTMWTALLNAQRFWDRLMLGGMIVIYKLGPKDARFEGYGAPIARIPYVRNGWRGMIAGASELFCGRAYVHEIKRLCVGSSFAFRVAWA